MTELVTRRFKELEQQMGEVAASRHDRRSDLGDFSYDCVDDQIYLKWTIKLKDLVSKVCGEDSHYFKELITAMNDVSYKEGYSIFESVASVFMATKEDYEKGYLSSYRSIIQAEIYDSELEQAKELLRKDYYTAAAVIAGVVLETALREICDIENIPHGKLDKMNADLAKAGKYNKNMQKQITAISGIRNSAAHGAKDEYTRPDVEQMIPAVELFLAQQFSP